ncbi:MAG: SsrA-binding protein SmpB [Pirellulales bacterium]
MANKGKSTAKPTAPPPGKASGKGGAKGGGKAPASQETIVSDNRKAKFRFEILETLECGIMLRGTEVKSLRNGKVSLEEAYARIKDGEVWLIGCDIPIYPQASIWNHEPKRPRKLLLHKREFLRFAGRAQEKGLTLAPVRMYFNERGIAKVLLGLCRGKKTHDKRETIKKRDAQRDMQRALRRR